MSEQSIVNTLDSGYGCAAYLSRTYVYKNLVSLVRLRYGNKVWLPAERSEVEPSQEDEKKNGAPPIFGEKYYLVDHSGFKTYHRKGKAYPVYQRSIFDLPHQDYIELEGKTSKGRVLKIMIWRWNNLLMRTKQGHDMKDKPFDVIASKVVDADTAELVFDKSMFVTIFGQRKDEITTQQAFESYRHRYDIEPSIKFCKQKLMLEKFQTPDQQHFDNWLVVVMAAFWLLFTARGEVNYRPKKWQQYKEVNKRAVKQEKSAILTPNQVQQGAQDLFLTFDPTPFMPVKLKKGKGRQKGVTLNPRTRFKIVKKSPVLMDSS